MGTCAVLREAREEEGKRQDEIIQRAKKLYGGDGDDDNGDDDNYNDEDDARVGEAEAAENRRRRRDTEAGVQSKGKGGGEREGASTRGNGHKVQDAMRWSDISLNTVPKIKRSVVATRAQAAVGRGEYD